MLSILIAVIIILFIAAVCVYFVDWIGIPHPFNMLIKAVIGICALVLVLQKAGLLAGVGF